MKVTVVNSFYRGSSVSGENLAVLEQTEALQEVGVDVQLCYRYSDLLTAARLSDFESALRVATGLDLRGHLPRARSKDDILLVNNLFPNFGTRWIGSWAGPVVTMIHNFRYLCANGLLLREGKPCTLCLEGTQTPALRHRCYRDSVAATLPLVLGNRGAPHRSPPLTRATVIVAQSERARSVFVNSGVPPHRVRLVPGFVGSPVAVDVNAFQRSGWLFAGRLSPEKGLRELMSIWPSGYRLDVVGDGPEREALERLAPLGVRFLGSLSHSETVGRMASYEGFIFPGVCWEGAHPRVLRESLSVGTPVLAAIGSSASDLLESHGGGLTYDSQNPASLMAGLSAIEISGEAFRNEAITVAQSIFGRERWQQDMLSVLSGAVHQS